MDYNNSRYGDSDSVQLSSEGSLLLESDWVWGDPHTYQAGEFCMAGEWEGGPEEGVGEYQALAVLCEPCQDEVGQDKQYLY